MADFRLPRQLNANPHYYDYLHGFDLQNDGTLEMVDGAGQMMNTVIKGRFRLIETAKKNVMQLNLTELAQYDPFSDEKFADLPDHSLQFTIETGVFTFYQEVVWKIDTPDEHPCLLYKTRYVFESDPIAMIVPDEPDNLYQILENKDMDDSLRYYYAVDEQQDLTLSALKKQNIPLPERPT